MIDTLGKRPFESDDDMDKWLDKNRGEKSAPPPPPEEIPAPPSPEDALGQPGHTPAPLATSSSVESERF